MVAPWPFSMWGIDVIGPINPKASNGHRFTLVAIDYFTKWVEAASYSSITRKVFVKFLQREIICRYEIPERIITDNGTNLNGSEVEELCNKFKIKHHNWTPYRPKMNGAVEAANKNIKMIVAKMVENYKDWHEKLPYALHAYRTNIRSSTRATPFSLVYGMEAVSPIEVEIPSLRVLMEAELEESEWVKASRERWAGRYRLRLKPPSQPHRSNRRTRQRPWRAACLSRAHRGLDRPVQRWSTRLAAPAPP
ncbi:PREDICTED: uncharacterized protein K02A2.6-like [Lupinus angustifolius]|uniref:uncharacterized protein K02A2.6-like n=1 Tax=Lupinus angustifolius TaxID=3871 RepID=UPI00092E88A4|nr:PREDICTED: uncharacterized protein K02A2.6-like [Lupinus angustifolius]